MRLSPLEERAKQLYYNPTALLWTDWNCGQENDATFDRLGDMLGVRWTREQVEQVFNSRTDPRQKLETISIPLTFVIQPEFQEAVKSMFGSKFGIDPPEWAKTATVVEGWDIPRDQFMHLARGASVAIPVEQMRQRKH